MKSNESDNDIILVDFDRTLATYESGQFKRFGPLKMGEPIDRMVERFKQWKAEGRIVYLFTARVDDRLIGKNTPDAHLDELIRFELEKWCMEHLGEVIPITNAKSYKCSEIYDDRAFQISENTGEIGLKYPKNAKKSDILRGLLTALLEHYQCENHYGHDMPGGCFRCDVQFKLEKLNAT